MKKEELVSGLASSYGREKAEEIIDRVIVDAGLSLKSEYSKDELLHLCDAMVSGSDRLMPMIGRFLKMKVLLIKE
ncbi:MAG: hypothetical protein JW900_10900 [Anaerolineae bacterium]|nr:hypothetical protein [Anaerolineae bacterium]